MAINKPGCICSYSTGRKFVKQQQQRMHYNHLVTLLRAALVWFRRLSQAEVASTQRPWLSRHRYAGYVSPLSMWRRRDVTRRRLLRAGPGYDATEFTKNRRARSKPGRVLTWSSSKFPAGTQKLTDPYRFLICPTHIKAGRERVRLIKMRGLEDRETRFSASIPV